MGIVEFLLKQTRMCESRSPHCSKCELRKVNGCLTYKTKDGAEKAVKEEQV